MSRSVRVSSSRTQGFAAAMANIRDVARHAGVSIATVSAVLNGKGSVQEVTRQRVWRAVEAVDYAPNGIARSLRSGRSRLIGLVVSEITNPHFASLARAVEDAAMANGYVVIVCNTDEDERRESAVLSALQVQRVAGIILAPSGHGDPYRRLLERSISAPLVTIDRHIAGLAADFVGTDNRAASQMITEYLLRLGHRRIGFIGGRPGISSAEERFEGFRRALQCVGLAPDPALCAEGDFRGEAAYAAAQAILTRPGPPSAIVAANNVMAVGTMQAVLDLGFRCPADISIGGVDDFPWSAALRPRLTTVGQPIEAIGRQAVAWLIERMAGWPEALAARCRSLPPLLTVRDSCAPVAMAEASGS